jgi:hypothetical protein
VWHGLEGFKQASGSEERMRGWTRGHQCSVLSACTSTCACVHGKSFVRGRQSMRGVGHDRVTPLQPNTAARRALAPALQPPKIDRKYWPRLGTQSEATHIRIDPCGGVIARAHALATNAPICRGRVIAQSVQRTSSCRTVGLSCMQNVDCSVQPGCLGTRCGDQ